jgi:hypothetical protein
MNSPDTDIITATHLPGPDGAERAPPYLAALCEFFPEWWGIVFVGAPDGSADICLVWLGALGT